jgi:nucleoside-diphosphate-sugar epimerase
MLGLGVYAALMKAQGRPLAFPATQAAFEARLSYTGADLLARAMLWAATSPTARGQDFNVANGDEFSWSEVWPAFARAFGMAPAGPEPRALREEMPALAGLWRELARREGLAQHELSALVDWHFMDATLALGWDQTMALDKLRRHGFGDTVDTPAMILNILAEYRRQGILPAP